MSYDLAGLCSVYFLFDPRTRKPFYVGISKYPYGRFRAHQRDPASEAWPIVSDLVENGFSQDQILKIYKVCRDRNAAWELEHKLIHTVRGLINKDRRRFRVFNYEACCYQEDLTQ